MKQITVEEVRRHNNINSAWITVNNDVLDITQFMNDHPGGEDLLLPYLGGDATKAFFDDSTHTHSENALDLVKKLKIGYLSKEKEGTISETPAKYEYEIDWDKPVVWQVGKLGKDYQRWVHTPIHTNDPVKLLGGFLENFTTVQWWAPLAFWIPIICGMLYYIFLRSNEHHTITVLSVYILGICLWPFFEYCLHRYVYHVHTTSYWANTLHFLMHGVHHLTPMDRTRLVAPPVLSSAIYLVLSCFFYPVLPTLTIYLALAAGVMTGYLVYDEMHFFLHHGVSNKSPLWLQRLKTHHNDHHYKNYLLYFGVSNSFTDDLFHSN